MEFGTSDDKSRVSDLVLANRILVHHGVLDGFGHVSVRSTSNTNQFYMSRRRAPGLVSAEGVLTLDADSEPVDAELRAFEKKNQEAVRNSGGTLIAGDLYGERYIHGEIYRRRPDVQAIVHSHSPAVIPFGVSDIPLRAVMHMAGFLPMQTPVFDIRDAQSTGGMLITSIALGTKLAASLGSAPVVLMRGHGNTVVGATMKEAVFRAIYTELNARIQMDALRLTSVVNYLNAHELEYNIREISDFERPWERWSSELTS